LVFNQAKYFATGFDERRMEEREQQRTVYCFLSLMLQSERFLAFLVQHSILFPPFWHYITLLARFAKRQAKERKKASKQSVDFFPFLFLHLAKSGRA